MCAVDGIGIGELPRAHVKTGHCERPARRRHHAAVRGDGDQIQKAAQPDDPHEAQVEIAQQARADQRVGGEVQHSVQVGVALGHERDQHDLDAERDDGQP